MKYNLKGNGKVRFKKNFFSNKPKKDKKKGTRKKKRENRKHI